jgi:protein-tyrosine-phosphatase
MSRTRQLQSPNGRPMTAVHVSFVCRFNQARSVMAAVMFTRQLQLRGLGDVVRVSSAGTSVLDGGCVDPRAARVLAEHGYPSPAKHLATQLGDDHLGADLVVALGEEHVGLLQRRGVVDGRIRYVEVGNPCWGLDFENAFTAIAAAMAELHRWVNQRIPLAEFETTVGWRFWTWRPGEVLRSPFAPGCWPSTSVESPACPKHTQLWGNCCGWFADLQQSDSLARARQFVFTTRRGVLRRQYAWEYVILGKINLVEVIPFWQPPYARNPGTSRAAEFEWQGRHGTIVELRLLYANGTPEVIMHAQELADRYGVPVTVEGKRDQHAR